MNSRPALSAYLERVDEYHANPKRLWTEMGRPEYLNRFQVEQLMVASRVLREPFATRYTDGMLELEIDLAPHTVAAITIEFGEDDHAP
jgi:xylan 1,4-beta-xylosidase